MKLDVGFVEASPVAHLTHTTLSADALCGNDDPVVFHGEPDLAVMCEECDRLGRLLGGDAADWMQVSVSETTVLRHAA